MTARLRHSGECASRVELAELCNRRGLVGYAAEVGTLRGDFAVPFVRRWRGRRLYCVDVWERLPAEEYDDAVNALHSPEMYAATRARLRRCCGDRARMLRMRSTDAAARLAERKVTLDFVYIDANHSYDHVRADLAAWWALLRPGGVLAGHDVFNAAWPGVTQALLEFLAEHDLMADLINGEFNYAGVLVNAASYYITKPT